MYYSEKRNEMKWKEKKNNKLRMCKFAENEYVFVAQQNLFVRIHFRFHFISDGDNISKCSNATVQRINISVFIIVQYLRQTKLLYWKSHHCHTASFISYSFSCSSITHSCMRTNSPKCLYVCEMRKAKKRIRLKRRINLCVFRRWK